MGTGEVGPSTWVTEVLSEDVLGNNCSEEEQKVELASLCPGPSN